MRKDYYKKMLKDRIITIEFGKKAEKQLEKLKKHKPKMYKYVMEAKKKLEGDPLLGKGPISKDINMILDLKNMKIYGNIIFQMDGE